MIQVVIESNSKYYVIANAVYLAKAGAAVSSITAMHLPMDCPSAIADASRVSVFLWALNIAITLSTAHLISESLLACVNCDIESRVSTKVNLYAEPQTPPACFEAYYLHPDKTPLETLLCLSALQSIGWEAPESCQSLPSIFFFRCREKDLAWRALRRASSCWTSLRPPSDWPYRRNSVATPDRAMQQYLSRLVLLILPPAISFWKSWSQNCVPAWMLKAPYLASIVESHLARQHSYIF